MTGERNTKLMAQANQLIDHLEAGDNDAAMEAIDELYKVRDCNLYIEIGKLTRQVHNAIRNFHAESSNLVPESEKGSTDPSGVPKESRMDDAKDRLEYVIRLTESAANKTMDMVEDTVPISKELRNTAINLKQSWQRLLRREMKVEEFRALYKDIDLFLDFAGSKATLIEDNLTSILMAQGYQDLTGQMIKKVITLVHDVEASLVGLVSMASQLETITGIQHDLSDLKGPEKDELEGPQMKPETRSDVVASQDDVDDLLSSLGF